MGHLGRTQKSQAPSDKKLKAYACKLEQKLEARTREVAEALEQQTATAGCYASSQARPASWNPCSRPSWRTPRGYAKPSSARCTSMAKTRFALLRFTIHRPRISSTLSVDQFVLAQVSPLAIFAGLSS